MMSKIKHLYIHVPFCNSICFYCDFCHRIYDEQIVDKWLDTIEKEINEKCFDQYETIYIGGGTPTSLNDNQLDRLLSLISKYSNDVLEYTIEVNPESLNQNKIDIFKKYGINRISMGVQTSNDELLKKLNRKHTYKDVIDCIMLLKENGITNISIDLMYGLPNQSKNDLNSTIDDFISLDIPHVSLYSLTIEENTVFGKTGVKQVDSELDADMYELICNRLKENNYNHYEVSNFARNGYESKHNIGYWKYEDFLGISLGASSKIENIRYTNTFNFNEYFNDFNSKQELIELSKEDIMFENIMMSLRMKNGLNITEFNNRYNCDFICKYSRALNNSNILIENDFCKVINLEIINNTLLDFMNEE